MSFLATALTFRRVPVSSSSFVPSRMKFSRQLFGFSNPAIPASNPPSSPLQSGQNQISSWSSEFVRDCNIDQFYEYTSGRWLWNEKSQLTRRRVKFNLRELLEVSAQAIGAKSCVKIEKLPEGNFSKVFLLSMDDGRDLVAKLPNPNAGQPHLTTASEVATMDYVRNVLGIPSPQVYGWSSSTDNPVGAEYILMERCRGIELGKVWESMSWKDKFEVVKILVGYEKTFASANYPMYGSLYYAKDIPNSSSTHYINPSEFNREETAFVIGPTTNRAWFDLRRDAVQVNRGPWLSIVDLLVSRTERELACIEQFSSFPDQQGIFGPNQYCPSKSLKIAVLQDYMKVVAQILPKDTNLSKPTLWHSDLHTDNIFVDPSQPTQIVNIIDWQAVNISPLFLQVRHPSLIEFEGPIPEGFAPIELPTGFDVMSEEEQHKAKTLRAAQSLFKLYEILMLRQCPEIGRALRFRDSLSGQITGLTSSIFSDGEPIVQGMLIRLQEDWGKCVGQSIPCPLSFTPEDKMQQQDLEAKWCEGIEVMHQALNEIGVYQGWDGWVNHNDYSMYKERLTRCRETFLDRHARTEEERSQWLQAWPFQDKTSVPNDL